MDKYIKPELEFVELELIDILTASIDDGGLEDIMPDIDW